MKVSLKWLAEFFPQASEAEQPLAKAAELRTKLPLNGIEIGAHRNLSEGLSGVVVGLIEKADKHPQADRLRVCTVKIDDQNEALQIVCGASNARAGLKVAVATIGCVLPGDFKIQQSKIRGVESFGMLCSGKELAMSDEGEGILELSESAPVGSSLVKALGLNDEVWEAELTPDRSDCLSHLGIAREIGRLIGKTPEIPEFDRLDASSDVALLSVEVQDAKACPLYGAQLFEGVEQTATPQWMKRTLESLGQRSIGPIVDITNFVLQELGHPLHAFDADEIKGSKILVRRARSGEKLVTLDEVERTLSSDDLVIADIEKPLALAGVMGGLKSGVTAKTKRVVLEAALFDPIVVRQMAARHKIHSEASHRFERGVDAANIVRAAGRASLLFKKLVAARRRGSYLEIKSAAAESLLGPHSLNLDLRAFKNIVGLDASAEEVCQAFKSLQIPCQVKSPNVLKIDVPTHRLDLLREVDLVEEAARLLGYDRIPEKYPAQRQHSESLTLPLFRKIQKLRRRALETGLFELMPYSFVSNREKAEVPQQELVTLTNPLSNEWAYMRPNLSFGLLSLVTRHVGLGQLQGAFFDLGNVFSSVPQDADKGSGVRESLHLGWALMGQAATDHWSSDKRSEDRKRAIGYFEAKGVFEKLLEDLSAIEGRWASTQFQLLADLQENAAHFELVRKQAPWIPFDLLHPYRSSVLLWPGKPPGQCVGYVGELHPQRKGDWLNLPTGLSLGVAVGEVRVTEDLLAEMSALRRREKPETPSPYGKITLSRRLPVVERDFSCVFPAQALARDIEKAVRKAAGPLLLDLKCLDLYRMPDGRASLAYRLYLQGQEGTLEEAAIAACMTKVLDDLKKGLGAEQRA